MVSDDKKIIGTAFEGDYAYMTHIKKLNDKIEATGKLLDERIERIVKANGLFPGYTGDIGGITGIREYLSYDDVMAEFIDGIKNEYYNKVASRKKWIYEIKDNTYLDMSSSVLIKFSGNSYNYYQTDRDDLVAKDWIIFNDWKLLELYRKWD